MRADYIFRSALVLLLCLLPACSLPGVGDGGNTLKIAVIAPFGDDFASLGQSTQNGVVLAVETWNQRGGVLGQTVQVILEDSQCDYRAGREAAQAAIAEGAFFIVGAVCADASEGVAQVAMQEGVLQITPASVNLDLTLDGEGEVRPLVFRVPFVDPAQGTAMAEFALENLGAARAAVLYAEGSTYGSALADAFEQTFKAADGEIVAHEAYDQDSDSFFDVLDIVREAVPDVIYVPGYYTIANRLVPQARAFGLSQIILGSDGWDSPDLRLDNVNRCYFTSHYFPQEPRTAVEMWIKTYEARYIVQPDALATLSYDATNMLFSAIVEAGTTAPQLVAATMETMTFDAVSGEITFDEAHNPIKPILLLKAQDGQVLFVERIVLDVE